MDKDIFKKQLKASLGDRFIDGSEDKMQFGYMREKQSEIDKLKSELEWYRTYGEFINNNFPKVDAEACSFADGDEELFKNSSFGND